MNAESQIEQRSRVFFHSVAVVIVTRNVVLVTQLVTHTKPAVSEFCGERGL